MSEYYMKRKLKWRIDRSYIVKGMEDARLVRVGMSRENKRVFNGKESSLDDFFFMYVNLFNHCLGAFYGIPISRPP